MQLKYAITITYGRVARIEIMYIWKLSALTYIYGTIHRSHRSYDGRLLLFPWSHGEIVA